MLRASPRESKSWRFFKRTLFRESHLRSRAITGRRYATATTSTIQDSNLRSGDHVHGFTVQRTKEVPELQLTALHLPHDKTGADYMHVARDDTNNVFSIGFKTNPPDATGVPHILEHTTLCGSERYVMSQGRAFKPI